MSALYLTAVSTEYGDYLAGYSGVMDRAFDADADGDGYANAMEYLFLSDPTQETPASIVHYGAWNATDGSFVLTRNALSTTDTTQVFQYSEDLENWTSVDVTSISSDMTDVNGMESVTIDIDDPDLAGAKLFWRVILTQ